jgi:hypothetical protein
MLACEHADDVEASNSITEQSLGIKSRFTTSTRACLQGCAVAMQEARHHILSSELPQIISIALVLHDHELILRELQGFFMI